jgi:hypothetical protein
MKNYFKLICILLILVGVLDYALIDPNLPQSQLVPSAKAISCSYNQASCSWDPTIGAVSYAVKVTEVESSNVVYNNQVQSSITRVVFNVTSGKTYKCDVTATNSCGSSGGTGTDSLLCAADGIPSFTPAPTSVASVAPTPTPAPTQTPQACGYSPCVTDNNCQAGLVCVAASSGGKYCSRPEFQQACASSPSVTSCCSAPVVTAPPAVVVPPPQLPHAGVQEQTATITIISLTLIALGLLGLVVL